jgi:NodT family efflux transporter outer membrane factor (OMF) lipoprotein
MVMQLIRIFFVVSLLSLNSCFMVGPDYKEPSKRVAKHWVNHGKDVHETPVRNAYWWQAFHDPTLSCLINIAYRNNYSIQIAATRVLKSRALVAQSVGKLYPQKQEFLSNLTYQRIGGQEFQFVLPPQFTTIMYDLSANWELDFWGKYRRKILSDSAGFLSSYAAYDSALVTLTSDLAYTYINLRMYEELEKVIEDNIKVQEASYSIANTRYLEGETNQLDVQFAKTELYKTKAALPSVISELQRNKDRLGLLLGVPPDEVNALISKSYGIPKAPSDIAVGIPMQAINFRPDVYEARLKAIAQSEGIGAVKANLYPVFSLSGTFGFSSNDINNTSLSEIFNWANRMAFAGPTVLWPILNYGQITNMVRQQDAAFQEALLSYLQVVLSAQQEVQDNITAFDQSKIALAEYQVANQSALKSTDISLNRYKEGETDFTSVLLAQSIQLSVQKSLTEAKGKVPTSLVMLYRSLGGGWQIRGSNDIVANEIKQEMARRTYWGDLLKQENHTPPKTKRDRFKELYLPNW